MPATVAGLGVLELLIDEPRQGLWIADATLRGDAAPTGQVTIDIDGETWVGTVDDDRAGVYAGRVMCRIVGGANGLRTDLPSLFYDGAALSTVVAQVAAEAGEALSAESHDLSAVVRPRWERHVMTGAQALDQVAESTGLVWRVQRDGTVLLTDDSGAPTRELLGTVVDRDPTHQRIMLAPLTAPVVRPGELVEGQLVTRVETRVAPGGVRQSISLAIDRTHDVLRRLTERQTRRQRVLNALHPATVVSQNDDGTLDITPDDAVVGSNTGGESNLRVRYGLPGFTATVPAGSRVLLGFEGADPSRPYVASWEPGAVTEVVFDGGAQAVARKGDTVVAGYLTFDASTPALFWQPYIDGLPGAPPVPIGLTPVPLDGFITSGNEKLKA